MGSGKLQLVSSREHGSGSSHEFSTSARSEDRREQVAAVCYRCRDSQIEFLLVRTRRGRWTFPKGGVVSGFTRAESAALEAFEEAGVHGRIEEAAFARYTLRKRKKAEVGEAEVRAHLCEVTRLGEPEEAGRHPTWFSPAKAKRRLKEGRTSEEAIGLARVVDTASARIEGLSRKTSSPDPLRRVQFEASDSWVRRFIEQATLAEYARRKTTHPPAIQFSMKRYRGKLLQLGPAREDDR
jgi:8-oxo-dGTP pyrophosphatase MutT (NUDIX family)